MLTQSSLILAVGGGSVIDYSKALSISVNYDGDPWEKYYLKFEEPDCETLPVGAVTNATHGMTLSAVSLPYYRYIMPYGLKKFVRFAETVWNVKPEGKNDTEIAEEGLSAMEQWMKELGLVMNLTDLGANESMIPDLVKGTIILKGGYKVLDEKEIAQILKESF